jgi:hypothetical protein
VYETSPLVIIGGVVLLIFGLLLMLVGGVGVAVSGAIDQLVTQIGPVPGMEDVPLRALRDILIVIFGVALVLGILHLISSVGVFLHKQWARIVGIILAVLGTLLGVLSVASAVGTPDQAGSGDLVVALVMAIAYGFTLYALAAGGGHFRRRYPG